MNIVDDRSNKQGYCLMFYIVYMVLYGFYMFFYMDFIGILYGITGEL